MWFVYILKCADGTFYTGIAKDLQRRVKEHNISVLGAKYTRGRRPVKLVYAVRKKNMVFAAKFEYQIKMMTRLEKIKLIRAGKQKYKYPRPPRKPARHRYAAPASQAKRCGRA